MTNGYASVPVITPETIKAHNLHGSDIAVWYAVCSFPQWERRNGKLIKTKDGTCFPTIRAIAERSGCTERSVNLALKKLEALGHIVRTPRHGKDGEQRSNDYTLFANPQAKSV